MRMGRGVVGWLGGVVRATVLCPVGLQPEALREPRGTQPILTRDVCEHDEDVCDVVGESKVPNVGHGDAPKTWGAEARE